MATLELRGTVEKELEGVEKMGEDARSVGLKGSSYRKTRAQRNASFTKGRTTEEISR